MAEHDTEAQQQQAELNQLEYTISDEALNNVGALPGQQPQQDDTETAEIVKQLLDGGFAVMAPAWEVTGEETEQLANVYGPLIDKYMPGGFGDYGLELNAIFLTVGVFASRLGKDRKYQPQPEGGESATETE